MDEQVVPLDLSTRRIRRSLLPEFENSAGESYGSESGSESVRSLDFTREASLSPPTSPSILSEQFQQRTEV